MILYHNFFWANQEGGDLARHCDLQPIVAPKGGRGALQVGGLRLNSTVTNKLSNQDSTSPESYVSTDTGRILLFFNF